MSWKPSGFPWKLLWFRWVVQRLTHWCCTALWGFCFLNTWQVLGRGNKERDFDVQEEKWCTAEKLWCSEKALYVYNIIQRTKSCSPRTPPPQVDLAERHSSQRMSSQWLFSVIILKWFYLLKGLLFPKLWFSWPVLMFSVALWFYSLFTLTLQYS